MPIYCITGFSPVPGDSVYLDAETPAAAITRTSQELADSGLDDPLPVAQWDVLECPIPFTLCLFRD